jgi:hypothetical protein
MMDLTPIGSAATLLAAAKAAEPYLLKVLGAPLEQIGGLLASPFEEMRKRRAERFARIVIDADAQVKERGAEPIQIPDYISLPLLEKATLVDDEDLQKMWACLLASASHPERAPSVSQSFPNMLAGLSPRDAQFLEVFFSAAVRSILIKIPPPAASAIAGHSRVNREKLGAIVANSNFRWDGNEDRDSTLDNLVGLGIVKRDREIPFEDFPKLARYLLNEAGIKPNKKIEVQGNLVPHSQEFYSLSVPGAAFVMACRPLNTWP